MKFTELELHPDLQKGIEEAGFTECTPIQNETFEYSLNRQDVLGQSQTGTGKTAAFLITIYQHLLDETWPWPRRALVIAPTRELAVQIEQEAILLGAHLPFETITIYGGVGYGKQEQALQSGVELVIGTPGRLLDFSQSRKLDFSDMGIVVIDEADRLFDMGFLPDLRKILRRTRKREERLTMLFSATLGTRVAHLAWEYMNRPVEIEIDPEQITVDTVEQELYHVSRDRKMELLLGVLEREKPENCLIFTNTKQGSYEVAQRLKANGYPCEYIMGDLTQRKRLRVIDGIKEGRHTFVAATDVAARGLHIDDLELVVNYDLPENPEGYVHRIGRTARVGKKGKAISLACERYVYGLEAIEEFVGMKIPVVSIDQTFFHEDSSAGRRFPLERSGRDRERPARGRKGHGESARSRPRRGQRPGGARSRTAAAQSDRPGNADTPENAGLQENMRPTDHREVAVDKDKTRKRIKADKSGTLDERIEYYRQKYGEDFKVE
jgi:ATP-dependent RNA helicase RhlB